jgi:hypothetical protein
VPHDHLQVVPRIQINVFARPQHGTNARPTWPSFLIYCGAKRALRLLFACDFGRSVPADSLHKLSPTVREMTMSRIISAGRCASLSSGWYDQRWHSERPVMGLQHGPIRPIPWASIYGQCIRRWRCPERGGQRPGGAARQKKWPQPHPDGWGPRRTPDDDEFVRDKQCVPDHFDSSAVVCWTL